MYYALRTPHSALRTPPLRLLVFSLFFLFSFRCFSQVTLLPNESNFGLCPQTERAFEVVNPNNCTVELEVATTCFATLVLNNQGILILKVTADEVLNALQENEATVNLKVTCSNDISNQIFKFPILTVASSFPTVTSTLPPQLLLGRIETYGTVAKLNYKKKGTEDQAEVDAYVWTVSPNSWTKTLSTTTSTPGTNNSLTVSSDLNSAMGDLCVVAKSSCVNSLFSPAVCIPIDRIVGAPCPINGLPNSVPCNNNNPISVSCTPPIGVTGYSYQWDVPPGWTLSGNGQSSVTITPGGFGSGGNNSGGVVKVKSSYNGISSNECTKVIAVTPLPEGTTIIPNGNFIQDPSNNQYYLCQGLNGTLTIPDPFNVVQYSSISVRPTASKNPYVINQVSPTVYKVTTISGTPNYVTITFDIQTICGTTQLDFTFFIGTPTIINPIIDGQPGQIVFLCAQEYDSGSLYVQGEPIGDIDGVVDSWAWIPPVQSVYINPNVLDFNVSGPYPQLAAAQITAIMTNVCGVGEFTFMAIPQQFNDCHEKAKIVISPNPGIDIVSVSVIDKETFNMLSIENLKVVDVFGTSFFDFRLDDKFIEIYVANYSNGMYYIFAEVNGKIYQTQMSVQH